MPVGGGSNVPANFNLSDPAGYMEPPKGMTQAQALEEMANMALAAGAVSNGTWNQPTVAPPKRSFRSGLTSPHASPAVNALVGATLAPPPRIPKSQRFHEPAATPQAEVIEAYKRAKLTFTKTGLKLTGPMQTEYTYGIEMVAECKAGGGHPPGAPVPALSCTCGFYAMYDADAIELGYGDGNCTLEVQMFGRVVKGRTGCRAQKQRIVAVHLDGRECDAWLCSGKPIGLGMPDTMRFKTTQHEQGVDGFEALCSGHFEAYNPMRRASLAQLRNLTGLEFSWRVRPINEQEEDEPE